MWEGVFNVADVQEGCIIGNEQYVSFTSKLHEVIGGNKRLVNRGNSGHEMHNVGFVEATWALAYWNCKVLGKGDLHEFCVVGWWFE